MQEVAGNMGDVENSTIENTSGSLKFVDEFLRSSSQD